MNLRNRAYDRGWLPSLQASVPVISIGNLTVGGTGKTPVTRWLVGWFADRGLRPAVLHGGYAADEPALHRRWYPDVPVLEGRDRAASAETARGMGADVVLLDDGFQHRRLARDLDIVLIAAERWDGPIRLLPRGAWREGPASLRRADVVLVTTKSPASDRAHDAAARVGAIAPATMIGILALRPDGWQRVGPLGNEAGMPSGEPTGPVLALAGVAEPELFRANVEETGVSVDGCLWFADHHEYSAEDIEMILVASAGRPVVTTVKDAIKLERLRPGFELWVLEQRVAPEHGIEPLFERLTELVVMTDTRSAPHDR